MSIAAFPFHIAANWVCDWNAYRLSGEMFFDRALEVGGRRLLGLAGIIHRAPGIDEPPVAIENIEVRRAERSIKARDLLRFVMQVKPRKFVVPHTLDHVRKIILSVGIGTVRIDADKAHSAR